MWAVASRTGVPKGALHLRVEGSPGQGVGAEKLIMCSCCWVLPVDSQRARHTRSAMRIATTHLLLLLMVATLLLNACATPTESRMSGGLSPSPSHGRGQGRSGSSQGEGDRIPSTAQSIVPHIDNG
jgi:hypothetical protein